MNVERIRRLLEAVRDGRQTPEDALNALRDLPFEDLGFAKIDHHRQLRRGFPEVILCRGKTTPQVVEIFRKLAEREGMVLATRAEPSVYEAVHAVVPAAEYHEAARAITYGQPSASLPGNVLIVSAGTADIPVAEEAAITAQMAGATVTRLFDVGVAGLHRLLGHRKELEQATVIIVVAGMEGALASVVGGLVDKPLVAVPTSVGYGASFHGLAPLLTMLNSCASGVAVVNIDNGFGAGHFAALLCRTLQSHRERA